MRKILLVTALLTVNLMAEKIYAMFDVEAKQEATLSLEVGGTVQKLNVDIGDRVKKGDVLLVLENSKQKQARDKAMYNYKHAKSSFDRYKKLKGVIDKEKFESVEFNKNVAYTDYESAKIAYEKTFLKAPFDGVISDRMIEIGSNVNAGQSTKLIKLTNDSEVKLVISFDEKYWRTVKVGDPFHYRVDGDKTQREGVVSKIYPTVNPKNRKLSGEVITKGILPGLFGDGYIESE
ncbi:MAG: efflux RND transporter periplasmic adaptor subunit [Campylobacterales bacterium]|nr:efflux RND transporter periplasmic adaptor subunit [Campylobacterales bacterium]